MTADGWKMLNVAPLTLYGLTWRAAPANRQCANITIKHRDRNRPRKPPTVSILLLLSLPFLNPSWQPHHPLGKETAATGDYKALNAPTSAPHPGSQIMPTLIFHITQDLQRNHMCTQPFVFVSNEMRSAIIRGWTGRAGLTGRRGGRRKEGVDWDVRKGWQETGQVQEGAKARSWEPVEGEEVRAGGMNKGTRRREKKRRVARRCETWGKLRVEIGGKDERAAERRRRRGEERVRREIPLCFE